MAVRTRVIVGVLWLASLAVVGVTARAQAPQPAPKPRVEVPGQNVISGNDIGFRVESWQGSRPVGTLVIRVDGQWVEPGGARRVMPITR